MILKNIKEFVKLWKEKIAKRVAQLNRPVELAIVQVGNVEASNRYVRNKVKDCEEVGIIATVYKAAEDISQEQLISDVKQMGEAYDGIMVQLPLPPHIDARRVAVEAIDPAKDVDGFLEWSKFQPCTPLGIMKYLEYCGFPIEGSDVVVIGRSDIVGKPMAKMLTDANATVTLCHSKTKDLESKLSRADLIICAVGKPGFINAGDYVAPIVDVGINFVDGKLVGDVDSSLEDTNVTPVPGGVGLLTRCALLENVISTVE
jgi:methylenetetrahydrofolate dehydrogenase (NADP+)/methenyltetrahydrofolate cyclohydrolase